MVDTLAPNRQTARERLLDAAAELFYAEGVQSVGVDRVIERAGVAKASMYKLFGSKDELVRAYLARRHENTKARMQTELDARFSTARTKLLGVFDVQAQSFAEPGFRGCGFVSASAEAPPVGRIADATADYRAWVHTMFADLAREAGLAEPDLLARQLVVLYDGAGISAWLDHDPAVAQATTTMAAAMIEAAFAAATQ